MFRVFSRIYILLYVYDFGVWHVWWVLYKIILLVLKQFLLTHTNFIRHLITFYHNFCNIIQELETIIYFHSCYNSFATTQSCIDTSLTIRTHCPEFFANRDVLGKDVEAQMNLMYVHYTVRNFLIYWRFSHLSIFFIFKAVHAIARIDTRWL